MNISLEKKTPVTAVITLKMEKADYEADVTKAIKNFCQKAQMPGFRPGKIPFGMAKKLLISFFLTSSSLIFVKKS